MTIFFKKSQHFYALKRHFLCMFNPKVDKNCAKRAKKSIFPPIFAWNNCFSLETQAIWKKLKQLLGKTQENIQKLKQNEHQVLSCSQKKCKIKTPGISSELLARDLEGQNVRNILSEMLFVLDICWLSTLYSKLKKSKIALHKVVCTYLNAEDWGDLALVM